MTKFDDIPVDVGVVDQNQYDTGYVVPRRYRYNSLTPAEQAIAHAKEAVEDLVVGDGDGALQEALSHLMKAQDCVSDFVDGLPRGKGEAGVTIERRPDDAEPGVQAASVQENLGGEPKPEGFYRG